MESRAQTLAWVLFISMWVLIIALYVEAEGVHQKGWDRGYKAGVETTSILNDRMKELHICKWAEIVQRRAECP